MGILNAYDIGDLVRLGNHSTNADTAPFKDAAGVAADPTTITLLVKSPTVSTTYTYLGSPALLKETTGRYYADVTLDVAGLWSYELKGTGAIVAVEQRQLKVKKSLVA